MNAASARRLTAEFLGSAGLATVVIGSGIMGASLTDDTGLALLINSIATAFGLAVLILAYQTVSGAHFNPVVSLVDAALGYRGWGDVARYIPAQVIGCLAGAVVANLMFALPAATWSTTDRATPAHLLAEVVATAGLVGLIFALARTGRAAWAGPAVGAYIGAAYFFTSSTSFANPAITVGRMISDTFAGIAPASVLPYIGAQLVGAAIALVVVRFLFPKPLPHAA
ncbi:aquaporin [Agromyces mangrovi Wang et al. 2018]|uniref:aquaporin n=1 Tax=Agromyces mangrovi TaxID=1858653 RepID=UPI00257247FD|nr:MIP/aquaporin family protein [Agromyces mangrovi]BDZ64408.1 glycerol uptake transporter protein [Agromyces mangrovi]